MRRPTEDRPIRRGSDRPGRLVLALAGALALAQVAACADDGGAPTSDAGDIGSDPGDGHGDPDASDPTDVPSDPPTDAPPDAPPPEGGFVVVAPAAVPPAARVPIVVRAVTADGTVDASVSGAVRIEGAGDLDLLADTVLLRRGVGSVTTAWNGAAGTVEIEGSETGVGVAPATGEPFEVAGTITGDAVWAAGSVVRVTATTTVATGATLTVEPGVWVGLADGANLVVDGGLTVGGSATSPVVFAPSDTAWGGIVLGPNGGTFRHAILFGGGADSSRAFGHSNSQPVVFSAGGTVVLEDCVVQDSPGKAMGAVGGAWTLTRALVTRTDTGGEFEHVAVTITDSHYADFPVQDPAPRDDDNDAIYLLGDPGDATPPRSTITRTAFLTGADDGIDHNGSTVEVTESWIEGFDNECIAASSGGTITVTDTALVGCGQGLEAGYGAPAVVGRNLLVTECGVGLRFGDNYTREYTGTLTVEESVVFDNAEHAVWNWVLTTGAPADGRVSIVRSVLDTDEADSEDGEGNVVGTPTLGDDLRLAPGSIGEGIGVDGANPGLLTGRPR